MERAFTRYRAALDVAGVAIAGVLLARTAGALVAGWLVAPPPPPPNGGASHRLAGPEAGRTVDPNALAGLFGVSLPDAAGRGTASAAAGPAPGTAIPSTLDATLVATIEARPGRYSLAVITDDATRATGVYGVGDTLMGTARLLAVERRRVLVDVGGRTEVLEMGAGPGAPQAGTPTGAGTATRTDTPSSDDGGIRRVGANHYRVARSTIAHALTHLNELALEARIVPAFRNGVAEGFKVFGIRPGSLYARIGLESGDVIRRVNGYQMNSPDKALEVYQRLRDARRVALRIDRHGRTITKRYDIE